MAGLSGSDHARTVSRLNILRLGAGRLNFPVLAGVQVPLYSLLNVARLGATRLNYHSPKVFVQVDGVPRAYQKTDDSYKIRDLVIREITGHDPSRASFTAKGFTLTGGMDVIVTLGSLNNRQRRFGGTVLPTTQRYVGIPSNQEFDCSCIDYTWGLQKLIVTGRWYTTVALIAAELIATYAPGYTVEVQDGFADVEEFTATEEPLPSVLTRLCQRGSPTGDWTCDYHKVVRCFVDADTSRTPPTLINAVYGRSLRDLVIQRDPSQWITRVYVEGGGSNASTDVAAGETILPVTNAEWYQETGGTVKSGPQGPKHITYTGRTLGGGGGLVGPGASPTSAPVATLAGGAGVTDGAHTVAITFVTAAGESLPSPIAAITVGVVAAPVDAPTAGTPTIGTGPNPGDHDYAVTFVTAAGETTPGPSVLKATTVTAAPSSAPTPGTPTTFGGVDVGAHDYAVTTVTAIGETTPSPISGQVTVGDLAAPAVAPTIAEGAVWPSGTHTAPVTIRIKYAFLYAGGYVSLPSVEASATLNANNRGWDATVSVGDVSVIGRRIYQTVDNWATSHYEDIADNTTTAFANDNQFDTGYSDFVYFTHTGAPLTSAPGPHVIPLTGLPSGNWKLYRRSGGAGLKLVTSSSGSTYSDTTANASLGAAAPVTNTAYLQRIPLTAIPLGGALVTGRKLYRRFNSTGTYKLVTTLNATDTTFTDTVTNASLGANAPSVNTATANQIALTGIPIGAASVTARKVYMTAAAGSQLKLVTTIANNTDSTYTITMADGSLGANVPITDGSGLTQPAGQVKAGETSLIVAGTGAFATGGGWAVIGNGTQVIRYTGKTGSTLTGIPASGAGAIVAAIGYNSNITAAPQLTGIPATGAGSIRFTILKGDDVNLRVQVDDLPGQAALSALLTTAEVTHDGIKEDVIQDRRLSFTEATARGVAHLAKKGHQSVSATYTCKDQNAYAGGLASFNLGGATNLIADLPIKEVTISHFTPAIHPDFAVTVSND